MCKRRIDTDLENWSKNPNRKPLIILSLKPVRNHIKRGNAKSKLHYLISPTPLTYLYLQLVKK